MRTSITPAAASIRVTKPDGSRGPFRSANCRKRSQNEPSPCPQESSLHVSAAGTTCNLRKRDDQRKRNWMKRRPNTLSIFPAPEVVRAQLLTASAGHSSLQKV